MTDTNPDLRTAIDEATARRRERDAAIKASTIMPATVRRVPPKNRTRNSRRRIIR